MDAVERSLDALYWLTDPANREQVIRAIAHQMWCERLRKWADTNNRREREVTLARIRAGKRTPCDIQRATVALDESRHNRRVALFRRIAQRSRECPMPPGAWSLALSMGIFYHVP